MIKTRLQKQIEEIEVSFDNQIEALQKQKKLYINQAWKQHIEMGTLKQDLNN
jgi:hypothetical protein